MEKELQHLVCNSLEKTNQIEKNFQLITPNSQLFLTFARRLEKRQRDVAQLVAHYVRDVGVACSSHVFSTK